MSNAQNDILYESSLERFWDLLDSNSDFTFLIYANFLTQEERFYEKEYGRRDEKAYDASFDLCWKWDCEGMVQDIESTVVKYLMRNMNEAR